ncbi:hypothetical protein DERP_004474 [Dermatophagoides pteronyssinus]|uniref:DUF4773 domain-containing protein n=1 Tax=Dermatophagoides pteronyssinus TaxID=6956 RepID=A0ABQ8JP62_DERPT|nr:hypothetical protein DERP_004474 [Dermatophagoides pteronyssinus]
MQPIVHRDSESALPKRHGTNFPNEFSHSNNDICLISFIITIYVGGGFTNKAIISNMHVCRFLLKRNPIAGCIPIANNSCINNLNAYDVPCPIKQSRSISPTRKPPFLERPSVGCLVNDIVGPIDRECTLSITICFNPSCIVPLSEPAFDAVISFNFPTVIRDGKPCGFIILSGLIPALENGKIDLLNIAPITPFCPCLELNLSPTIECTKLSGDAIPSQSNVAYLFCDFVISFCLGKYNVSRQLRFG